jgi:FCD domain
VRSPRSAPTIRRWSKISSAARSRPTLRSIAAVHAAIFKAAGNAALVDIHHWLETRLGGVLLLADTPPARWREAVEKHRRMALEARDAAASSSSSRLVLALGRHSGDRGDFLVRQHGGVGLSPIGTAMRARRSIRAPGRDLSPPEVNAASRLGCAGRSTRYSPPRCEMPRGSLQECAGHDGER